MCRKARLPIKGTLHQRGVHGLYYYRLAVNGTRKEFALKTSNYEEAQKGALELDRVADAPNREIAFAQINAIKGYVKPTEELPLSEVWDRYSVHPDRARPLTPHEPLMYRSTLQEFLEYASAHSLSRMSDVTPVVVSQYVDHLRTTRIAVDTHNRKIRRLRKIFECLKEYTNGENPFRTKYVFRNAREEQGKVARRLAFTKEQEEALRTVLSDSTHVVLNKQEIRVAYYLGMFTGQRMKDCVLLQWQNVDMNQGGKIWVKQFKTGKEVTIPIAPPLYQVLQEALTWKENQYVCPNLARRYNRTDKRGKNIGNNLVNKDMLRPIYWIGLDAAVPVEGRAKKMTVYGFHSLRHSFCSFCAQANVPKAVLLSILGTDSEIADKYYTHVGETAQQEAVLAVSGMVSGPSLKERINRAVFLIDTGLEPSQMLLDKIRSILKD